MESTKIRESAVQNRVDRDCRFAGLSIAEDQFSLTAADRNERVNDDDAGL
jgi:hypothetical protein